MENHTPTPTPWYSEYSTVYGYGTSQTNQPDEHDIVCSVLNRADAAFIVRAVNCHEELVQALKEAIGHIHLKEVGSGVKSEYYLPMLKRVLAKAEGQESAHV